MMNLHPFSIDSVIISVCFNNYSFAENYVFIHFLLLPDLSAFNGKARGGVSVREGQGVVLMCTPPPHSPGRMVNLKSFAFQSQKEESQSLLFIYFSVFFCYPSIHALIAYGASRA